MSVHVHLIHQFTSLCQFRVVDEGYIKALLCRVHYCRLQHPIRELDLETSEYLRTYMPHWQSSSRLKVGLHNLPMIG
jgi:hypothetical protein